MAWGQWGSSLPGGAPQKPQPSHQVVTKPANEDLEPPRRDLLYLTFRGYGNDGKRGFSVLCGDDPPTITGGYAKWTVVDRPLQRGVTVFQGYDPVHMQVSLRFGEWDTTVGWHTGEHAAAKIENQIADLEWMAGGGLASGQSPFVYVNSYNNTGVTTNLVPTQYQTTAGISGGGQDTHTWPWIIADGIQWGKSIRTDRSGGISASRVYQECTFTLTNFQGYSKPKLSQARGTYFTTRRGRDTSLLIAAAPSLGPAFDVQKLANAIKFDQKNNPIHGTRTHLSSKMLNWRIPEGKAVWVPQHRV